MSVKDEIFKEYKKKTEDFIFDKSVVEVFDDMLNRSIPFYQEIQRMMVSLTLNFAQPQSSIVDLGCSNGNTCLSILKNLKDDSIRIIGIDNSKDMVSEAISRYKASKLNGDLEFYVNNISSETIQSFKKPSVFISSLTLQFIRPIERQKIANNIYRALENNGLFILIEKTVNNQSDFNRLFIDLYHSFKNNNGYSFTEIAQKRIALENVLVPFSIKENIELMKEAGFNDVCTFFQWYNFVGIVGIKCKTIKK